MHFVKGNHGIFIPQFKELELPPLSTGISGHFVVELIHARTGIVKKRLEFNNLITNVGLDAMATTPISGTGSLILYAAVGTGTTAPANTDTTLVAEISTRTSDNGGITVVDAYVSGTPDYHSHKETRLFSTAQANGNLTEIGFFSASSGGTMFSRQLFKDELGNPTTITKTSSDQLRITYELRVYPQANDALVSAANISGTSYDIIARAQKAADNNTWRGWFTSTGPLFLRAARQILAYTGALLSRTATSVPSGTNLGSSDTQNVAAYVSGNYYTERQDIWGTSVGNGAIAQIIFENSPRQFAIGFTPSISKDNTKKLTINSKFTWARHV